MKAKPTFVEKVKATWGDVLPPWIDVLAREVDTNGQSVVARRLNRSASLISAVLSNKYGGDLRAVELLVRGHLMAETVECPVDGTMATDVCLDHQRAPYAGHSPGRLIFYTACRSGCPHSRIGGES
jgi:hypothetical protein